MGGFLVAPVFLPIQPPLPNGTAGQVLTISASGRRVWAAGGGGGSGIGSYLAPTTTTGVYNDYNPTGFGSTVGRLDLDTTSGNIELTGIAAGSDAQLLIVTNIGVNMVLLDSLNAGSGAANRMRLIGQIALPQYASQLLCYYAGSINKWCAA